MPIEVDAVSCTTQHQKLVDGNDEAALKTNVWYQQGTTLCFCSHNDEVDFTISIPDTSASLVQKHTASVFFTQKKKILFIPKSVTLKPEPV